jgi:ferrous iron transport protein A
MNAPFQPAATSLDQLKVGIRARVTGIRWEALDDGTSQRLRHFGFDEGVGVEALHLGPIGRDPIAIRVGRMTVAIRRRHAAAIDVQPIR